MIIKRILYLGYYLKGLDYKKLWQWLNFVKDSNGQSIAKSLIDCFYCAIKYNISILEYFQFSFYSKDKSERNTYAGTGFMYEYQLKMNPNHHRAILDDKILFSKYYAKFMLHRSFALAELQTTNGLLEDIMENNKKLVVKSINGKCGKQVKIFDTEYYTKQELLSYMKKKDMDMLEEFIYQHDKLQKLSPSGVNTIRIITQLTNGGAVEILGCRLRISVNSEVDNLAAGNLAACVDCKTGEVKGPGVYSDIMKKPCYIHPVTGVNIFGFKIPYWDETIKLVNQAALSHPQNRSIGWDIVITADGPGLIEGNHDWCKLLWQLPVSKGLKNKLKKYY